MVLTEASAQGRPVVAQGRTDVLVGQVRRSGGGVWYTGFAEFEAAIDLLAGSPSLGDALGRAGRSRVERGTTGTWSCLVTRDSSLRPSAPAVAGDRLRPVASTVGCKSPAWARW